MTIRVLVVDDSAFFQRRIKAILDAHPAISVIGVAGSGIEAIKQVKALKPDLVTMDQQMPEMDGVTAVKEIMSRHPTPILMVSSLTYESAQATQAALAAGAVDYITKNFETMSTSDDDECAALHQKVLTIAGYSSSNASTASNATSSPRISVAKKTISAKESIKNKPSLSVSVPKKSKSSLMKKKSRLSIREFDALVIGASTGGPVAIGDILEGLPANFPLPILIVQHMPANFTGAFASRLNRDCRIRAKEAEQGDVLEPGLALVAPGGKQMLLSDSGRHVHIVDGDLSLNYKPCVDITFGSVSRALKGKVLAFVLTGMGQDGKEGCKLLRKQGATIWSQDEATSVVFGMPMAVAQAGYSDLVLPLDAFADHLNALM